MIHSIPCGDFDLNIAHPQGFPTLVLSRDYEHRLDVIRYQRYRASAARETSGSSRRLAIHLHVFYVDTFMQLLRQLVQCSEGLGSFDLWISTDQPSKAEALQHILDSSELSRVISSSEIRICRNQGRNLGPLLLELWPELCGYDFLLHLHGKRSIESDIGDDWLQELLETLLPSPQAASRMLRDWTDDGQLGLVMPQPPDLIRPYLNWGNNFGLARELAETMERGRTLNPQSVLFFPAGMMFWCRPAALQPLAAVAAGLDELPEEPLPVDGTRLHALERLVGHSCEAAGLQWRILCRRSDTFNEQDIVDQASGLSLWEADEASYQKAVARLAQRARDEAEQRLCAEANLKRCQGQLENTIRTATEQIAALTTIANDRDVRLDQLQKSRSWRYTAPLRKICTAIKRLITMRETSMDGKG